MQSSHVSISHGPPLGLALAIWPDLGHSNEGILGDMVQGFLEAHFFFSSSSLAWLSSKHLTFPPGTLTEMHDLRAGEPPHNLIIQLMTCRTPMDGDRGGEVRGAFAHIWQQKHPETTDISCKATVGWAITAPSSFGG